jgi:hypothetical protein
MFDVHNNLERLNEAIPAAQRCSRKNPCGALAYYDRDQDKPWRIADDGYGESVATFEEALAVAESWSCE